MAAVTNILWANGGIPTGIGSGDTVSAPGEWTFTTAGLITFSGNVSIVGDLDVQGDITQRGVINLTISDPFIDLGLGNSTTTSQAGGFTVQMAAASGVTAASVYRFVTTTQFEINDGGATALAPNQIIAITGLPAEFASNEGLYAVDSVSGTAPQVVNIKSTATPSAPFLQTIFQNAATTVLNAGAAFQTEISALAFANGLAFPNASAVPYSAGVLLQNYSAAAVLADFTASAAWTAVGAGSTTLQNAYNNGPTIVTDVSTPITFTLSNGGFDVQSGAVNFGAGALTAVTSFDVSTSGSANLTSSAAAVDAIRLYASAGSGGIDIDAGSAGIAMDVSGGGISLDAFTASNFSTNVGDLTLSALTAAVNITSGEATQDAILIDATHPAGGIRIQSGTYGIDIDGDTGAVLIQSDEAAVDAVKIDASNAAGGIDINAGSDVTIDSTSGGISLGAAAASDFTTSAGNLTLQATTGDTLVTAGGGVTLYAVTADIVASANAAAISLNAGLASNFTAATGDLSLTATAGSVVVTAGDAVADAIQLTASDVAGGIDLNAGSGGVTIDSTGGGISLDAAGASNFTVDSNTLTLQTTTSGNLFLYSASQSFSNSTSNTRIRSTDSDVEIISGNNLFAKNTVFLQSTAFGTKIQLKAEDTSSGYASEIDLFTGGNVNITTAYSTNVYSAPELSTYSLGDTNIYGYFGDIRLGNRYSRGVLVERAMGMAVPMEASENLPMCSIVAITSNNGSTPVISLARSGGTTLQKQVIGITNRRVATTTGGITEIYTVPGTEMVVLTSGSIVTADAGKPVYLNGTGLASLTPPSASGEAIIRVGYVTRGGASGGGGEFGNPTTPLAGPAAYIMFAPQFIAQIP